MTSAPPPVPVPAPLPASGPQRARLVESILEQAARQRQAGDRDAAARTVVDALRLGLWYHARLWSDLVSMLDQPADYPLVRQLWLDSPRRCHRSASILRAVAYAAARAGEQDEARVLLRRAIVQAHLRRRRPRSRIVRLARRVTGRRPAPEPPVGQAVPPGTRHLFSLLDAVVASDREQQRRGVEQLREHGEGEWLSRL